MALHELERLLKRGQTSELDEQRCADFRRKLSDYGFNYPNAQDFCWLHNKRMILEDLIDEARELAFSLVKEGGLADEDVLSPASIYRRVSGPQ